MADPIELGLNAARTFVNDPNPPPKMATEAGASAAIPEPQVVESAPLVVENKEVPKDTFGAPAAEGRFWVGGDPGDFTLFLEGADGIDTEIGKVANPEAKTILDKVGTFNDLNQTWTVDRDTALKLKEGKLPIKDYLKAKWHSGEAGIAYGLIGLAALTGKKQWGAAIAESDIEALKIMADERPEYLWSDKVVSDNLAVNAKWLVGQAVETTPTYVHGSAQGAGLIAKGAAALGSAALIGGVPLATVAADPRVASALVTAGFTAGVADFTAKVTMGSVALDMKKKGFTDKSIKTFAPLIGTVAGALEVAQFRLLSAPLKRTFVNKVFNNPAMKSVMSKWYLNYLKETGGEVTIEVAQQAVEEFGKNFAAAVEEKPELMTKKEDLFKILGETAVKSAAAFAVMKLPGAVVEGVGSRVKTAGVKAAVEKGEVKPEAGAVEKAIAGDDAELAKAISDVEKGIKKEGAAFEFGKKNAENDDIKAAIVAKTEALKIERDALLEGKELSTLTPAKQSEVIPIIEKLNALAEVGQGIEAGMKETEPMVPLKEPKTAAERVERSFLEKEGAFKGLERERESLQKEYMRVGDEVEARRAEGKPTKALDNTLFELEKKIVEREEKMADLLLSPEKDEEIADYLSWAGVEAIVPVEKLVRLERDLISKIEKAWRVSFEKGEAYARREVKNVQRYLQTLLKRSAVPKEEQVKFAGIIRNTQTIDQLEANYPEIRDRIFKYEEIERSKRIDAFLKKAVKAGKSQVRAKRPEGKFGDADTQAIVDNVHKTLKKTRSEASLDLTSLENELEDAADVGAEGYDPVRHAKALYAMNAAYYRSGQMSPRDSSAFVADLVNMMNGAKAAFLEKKLQEKEARQKLAEKIVTEILGPDTKLPEDLKFRPIESGELQKGWVGSVKAKFIGMREKAYSSLASIADLLAFRSGAKTGESEVEKIFRTGPASDKEKAVKTKWMERFTEKQLSAYGIEDLPTRDRNKRLRDIQKKLVVRHELGEFTGADGVKRKLVFSRAEAMKRYMEKQDPSLAENFSDPAALAYTPEMEKEIFGILTSQDKKFAVEQLALYRELYKEVNAVWRKVKGVDLPFNEFYSPIRAIGYEQKPFGEVTPDPFGERVHKHSTAGGWSKSRVKHLKPLAQMSAFSAFSEHLSEVAHYIAWEEKVREWNSLLVNPQFRSAVIGLYGTETFEAIQTMVERITKGSHEKVLMRGFDKWLSNLIVGGIVGKPIALLKQMTAIPAFTYGVPAEHLHLWMKEMKNVMTKGISEEWAQSAFVKSRGSSMLQELRALEEAARKGGWAKAPNVVEFLAYAIKKGDKASILIGGDALFRYYKSQGMTTEEAIEQTADVARKTQSSGDISDLSVLQGNTGAWRLFTAYKNQPVQFMRIEMQAFRAMMSEGFWKGKGRMGRAEVAKNLLIFHFIIPSLFQMVVDWGWDEEHQKRALILGGFNDIPLLANLISNLYDRLLADSGVKFGERDLLDTFWADMDKAVKNLQESEDIDEYINAFALLSDPVFKAFLGTPTKPAVNTIKGVSAAVDDEEYIDAFKLLAGYSPYMVEEQKERE